MEHATELLKKIILPDASGSSPEHSAMQKTMLDATPDCIKLLRRDGTLITMNRAGCLALGVPEGSDFGMEWLSLLPPDLRRPGTEALTKAALGEASRFSGRSESLSGTVYWDNLLTPLMGDDGVVAQILCVSRDVTENVLLSRALEDAAQREHLLAGEMQHRIKNLYTVISALSHFADGEADASDEKISGGEILRDKIQALSRASNAIFTHNDQAAALPSEVDVRSLISSVLAPYASRCNFEGNDVTLPHSISTSLTLYLHELATNCIKYGAFSATDGTVTVGWEVRDAQIAVLWRESGGPTIHQPPARAGFGTKMMDRLVQGAGGSINRQWSETGLMSELILPIGTDL